MTNLFPLLRQVQKIILDLVYPPLCAFCRKPGAWLCQVCVANIERFPDSRCIKCDWPLPKEAVRMLCRTCQRQPIPYLDGIRTIGPHTSPLREAIHALKYDKHQDMALRLGWLLAMHWQQHAGFKIDGLLPIPLHSIRQKERGFNQSERLAHAMSQHLMVPLRDDILIRTRNTISQVGLSRQQRVKNMGNAFVATPKAANKRWLLIDDVCTTGSTLMGCASALRVQGAQAVWAITLTRPFYDDKRLSWQDDPSFIATTSNEPSIWEWNT